MVWAAERPKTSSPSAVPLDVLSAIANSLAGATLAWERRTGEVPTERSYERLVATDDYEVWIICWPAGGELDLHDHGGSCGAFAVVSGCLDEARVLDGQIAVRQIGHGESAEVPAHLVHAVANRSNQPATSVHVYAPPIGRMGFYRRDDDGRLVALEP